MKRGPKALVKTKLLDAGKLPRIAAGVAAENDSAGEQLLLRKTHQIPKPMTVLVGAAVGWDPGKVDPKKCWAHLPKSAKKCFGAARRHQSLREVSDDAKALRNEFVLKVSVQIVNDDGDAASRLEASGHRSVGVAQCGNVRHWKVCEFDPLLATSA